jgi:4-diphosphocytidyl-2-C-methyl-D-erythritol kinase
MSGFSRVANSSDETCTQNLETGNIRTEFINDLEKVVCALYPDVASCLAWLKQYGDARMSGSGASVFLEVTSLKIAHKIFDMKPENIRGFVAKGLNQHPLVSYAD